jgi:hypothetical protein
MMQQIVIVRVSESEYKISYMGGGETIETSVVEYSDVLSAVSVNAPLLQALPKLDASIVRFLR